MSKFVITILILFATTSCKLPEKPKEARKIIVKDIYQEAAENSLCPQVTPSLLKAVAKIESSNRANVARFEKHHMLEVSATWDKLQLAFENATSHGKFQMLGSTIRGYGEEPGAVRNEEQTAIELAALHLGKCICGHEKGDIRKGLYTWNAGPNWRRKSLGVVAQAAVYAQKVMEAKRG